MKRKVDRLLEYLEFKGITENRATVDCQLSQGLIYQAKSGKADLGTKAVEKILANYTDLNGAWLITGEGEMLKFQTSQSSKGDNTIQVSGNNVDMRNINQSKGSTDDAKRIKELEQRLAEALEDKKKLQDMVEKMQAQISKLLEKI